MPIRKKDIQYKFILSPDRWMVDIMELNDSIYLEAEIDHYYIIMYYN